MRNRRRASSLLELIVVLGIILIASAMTIPTIQSYSGSHRLTAGVDSVRGAMADARARAIEQGRPYRLAVDPRGTAYRVAPDQPEYWDGSNGPSDDPNGRGMVLEKSLPGGVWFTVNGQGVPEPPASDSLQEKVPSGVEWQPVAVFLPTGTAREDAVLRFQVRGCKPSTLRLRGLTGSVTVQKDQ